MTDPAPSDPGPLPPGARRHCPRCGAPMGVLDAGAAPGVVRGAEARAGAAPEALYCGCCGLVVAAR